MQIRKHVTDSYQEGRSITRLTIEARPFELTFRIRGPLGKLQRRAVALLVFRQLMPLLEKPLLGAQLMPSAFIEHMDSSCYYPSRDEERGLTLSQAIDATGPAGKLGFSIRMRRLELGWTQAELARSARISRSHLSRIEKGHLAIQERTLGRLERALSVRKLTRSERPSLLEHQ